jgi:hypothetical protein
MIANVIQSIREEIEAMTSGHFVPYHILSVLVSIIAAIFLARSLSITPSMTARLL